MPILPKQSLQRVTSIVPRLLSGVLFGVAVGAIYQQLHQYSLPVVVRSVAAVSIGHILAALVLMVLNYGVMTGYDTLAIHHIRQALPYRKIALVAILSTVISNNIGFAVVANSLIRYRFYSRWGITTLQIAGISAFCNLSYGLGQMMVGGIVFSMEPLSVPKALHLPFHSIHFLGLGCLSMVAAYLVNSTFNPKSLKILKWRIPRLPLKITVMQVGIASLDWMLSAAIFYVLLPASPLLSYPSCLGMYLLAQFAGVISNVPGGLGVFETVMLLLLSPVFSPGMVIGSLLAFRGIYNFLPLVLTLGTLGLYELRQKLSFRS